MFVVSVVLCHTNSINSGEKQNFTSLLNVYLLDDGFASTCYFMLKLQPKVNVYYVRIKELEPSEISGTH